MAGPEGLEPPASRLEAASSIHLSYGPEDSGCADEVFRQPDVFDLTVSGTDQPQNEMCPGASRDFVPQNVVYLICIRAENSEDVKLLQPYPPTPSLHISDLLLP